MKLGKFLYEVLETVAYKPVSIVSAAVDHEISWNSLGCLAIVKWYVEITIPFLVLLVTVDK